MVKLLAIVAGLLMVGSVAFAQEPGGPRGGDLNRCTATQMGGSILVSGTSSRESASAELCKEIKEIVDGTWSVNGFVLPRAVTTDGYNLYVADVGDYTIRKIDLGNMKTTLLAGPPGVPGNQDGSGKRAQFGFPSNITTDGENIYVSDNQSNTILKIEIKNGKVSTFAGNGACGSDDGKSKEASFCRPEGITTDGEYLYVADNPNTGALIRKISIAHRHVTTLAGDPNESGTIDGVGAAARLNYPMGITTDGTNVYFTEWNGPTVRKVVIATGEVTTLAGSAGVYGSTDGIGSAASFTAPVAIATDGKNLFVTEWFAHAIRKIVIGTGEVLTLAVPDIAGAPASSFAPVGITVVGGNIFIADIDSSAVRKIK